MKKVREKNVFLMPWRIVQNQENMKQFELGGKEVRAEENVEDSKHDSYFLFSSQKEEKSIYFLCCTMPLLGLDT